MPPREERAQRSSSGALLERLFEIVVDRGYETIVVTDGALDSPSGPTILYANEAAAKRTGTSSDQLKGTPHSRIVPPDAWPGVLAQLRRVRDSRHPEQSELLAKDPSGKDFWIELSTSPVFDADGRLEYLVRVGRDITGRKRAEHQREMSQDLLASLFGAIDLPLIVADDNGQVIMANAAVQDALGWGIVDLSGKPLANLVAAEERARLTDLIGKAAVDVQRMEQATLRHRAGAMMRGNLQITRVKSQQKHHCYVVRLELDAEAIPDSLRHRAGRPVVAGKLQLVGFAALKEQLGPRWAELNERVFAIAHQVIRNHLQPGDICQPSGAEGFLVFFDHLDEADAHAKAALIGEEVRRRLVGELPEGTDMKIAAFAASVSVPAGEIESDQDLLDAFSRRLEQERERMLAEADQKARHLLETAQTVFQEVETVVRQPAPILLTRPPAKLKDALSALASLGGGAYALETDLFCLAGAGAHVLAKLPQGPMPLIMVPVQLASLSRRRDIEAVVKTTRSIGDASKAQIAVEIVDLPRGVIRSRLEDIAMRLAPLVRSVAFELPSADTSFASGLPMSTRLVTIPLGLLRDGPGIALQNTTRLIQQLKIRQCRLIVKDVGPQADLTQLQEAGVELVMGPAAG